MPEVNTGNTAWLLVSSALVLLMTPGLALFYGGLNRSKGVLNMMMMSFASIGLVAILWLFYGFSMSFGSDTPLLSASTPLPVDTAVHVCGMNCSGPMARSN